MERAQFEAIVKRYILPMFTGARIEDGGLVPQERGQRRLASLQNPQRMILRSSYEAAYQLRLQRSQKFFSEDAEFVQAMLEQLEELAPIEDSPFFSELINPLIRRTVAKQLSENGTDFINNVIVQFEEWSEQTYEGRRIAAAVGIDPALEQGGGVQLLEVYGKKFGAVLANGLETFLTAARNGDIVGYEPAPNELPADSFLAPFRFSRLAEWSNNNKIGIGLNRNGEILLFKNQKLLFSKRRGSWFHFTHDSVIQRAKLQNAFSTEVCTAVYQTALDVSFARTGGCIALIRKTKKEELLGTDMINAKDRLDSPELKGRCLRSIVGQPFQNLDRRLRQDIAAIDGATILDYRGNLIAAGAIVKVPSGSDSGARLASAQALGEYGLAIKISSDGQVQGFVPHDAGGELFSVG